MSSSLFAIGVPLYENRIGGFSPYGAYDPLRPDIQQYSLAGTYAAASATATRWYTDIRDPNVVNFTPAPTAATNLAGAPLVVAYDRMGWSYSKIRPDEWYYLQSIYRLARRGNAGKVRVRFPQPTADPAQPVTIAETSAVFEQLSSNTRGVGFFANVTLIFSQLGRVDGETPDLVWLPMTSD